MRLREAQLPPRIESPETRLAIMPAFSNSLITRRRLLGGAGVCGVLTLCTTGCDSPRPAGRAEGHPRLRLLGESRWPHRVAVDGTPAGGLSGIDYDVAKGEYLLLCDDRSDLAPVRFYAADWPSPGTGTAPVASTSAAWSAFRMTDLTV